jgi:hypothetical protein
MYGSNKLLMRKKAMDSLMKEKPMVEMKKRPMEAPAESGEEGEGGFVSFMVSPEEKAMILEMRKEKGGEEASGPESSEEDAVY